MLPVAVAKSKRRISSLSSPDNIAVLACLVREGQATAAQQQQKAVVAVAGSLKRGRENEQRTIGEPETTAFQPPALRCCVVASGTSLLLLYPHRYWCSYLSTNRCSDVWAAHSKTMITRSQRHQSGHSTALFPQFASGRRVPQTWTTWTCMSIRSNWSGPVVQSDLLSMDRPWETKGDFDRLAVSVFLLILQAKTIKTGLDALADISQYICHKLSKCFDVALSILSLGSNKEEAVF